MKNKGFTLIELLAVIIILGILSVLIIPKVTNMINEAERNANMTSAQNLVQAAKIKVSNNEIETRNELVIINYGTGQNKDYLSYTGDKPESGVVKIKPDGTIAMAVQFGDKCYMKPFYNDDIVAYTYDSSTCGLNASVFQN